MRRARPPTVRKLGLAAFLLPVGAVALRFLDAPAVVAFAAGVIGLLPIAWLIGRATDEAGKHTGPAAGGLLNATFGNAPELFLAFFALHDGLFVAVRGSLTGSIPANLLLMLGLTLVVARGGDPASRPSIVTALGLVAAAAVVLGVAFVGHRVEGTHRALAAWEVPGCVVLLALYAVALTFTLRRARREETEEADWSLRRSLALLGVATVASAIVVESVTSSLTEFSSATGLSLFFVSVVILALMSDTSEHGAAVLVARRGKLALAMEVLLRTIGQIAALVLPLIALVSWLGTPLPLDPRPVELAAVAASVVLAAALLLPARPSPRRGGVLVAGYVVCVVAFLVAG